MPYADPKKQAAYQRRWREENAVELSAYDRARYAADRDAILARQMVRYRSKSAEIIEKQKRYCRINAKAINARIRRRRSSDPMFRIECNLRSRIYEAIARGGKSSSTAQLVGCSIPNLIAHIEGQFRRDMSWENYGSVWHLDHRKPCASFDLTDPEQQRACFNFRNLQPLYAPENRSKAAKDEMVWLAEMENRGILLAP